MAFRNAAQPIGTTLTTLYTCPANYETVVHSLYISNTDSINAISVDIQATLTKAALGSKYLAQNISIPAGTTLVFDKPINLRPTDILKIKASAATCDAFASLLLTAEDTVAPN